MVIYRGERLFDSGPSRLVVGGVEMRHTMRGVAGGGGESLRVLGRGERKIGQRGVLMSDTAVGLDGLAGAVEAMMDGVSGELEGDGGVRYSDVLMVGFERGEVRLSGPRYAMDYRVSYVQVGG